MKIDMTQVDHTYDAKGLVCPIPVLRARKILMSLEAGQCLAIHVTDTSSYRDFKSFCDDHGHILCEHIDHETHRTYIIRAGVKHPEMVG